MSSRSLLRIGLLGASKISRGAIITPAMQVEGVTVSCVAARRAERASAFAREHGIPHVESDYAALAASEKVDLVYNALPPSEHAKWSIAALQAGKHVLCEKPFAMNAGEARRMVDAATDSGRELIEAFHYRFHPLFERILDILRSGEIGNVVAIEGRFNVPISPSPGELRYDNKLGGGACMDLGCYPIHWARTVMGSEPRLLSAEADWHESGVDVAMVTELEFAGGVKAQLRCSMSEALPDKLDAELAVFGDGGKLIVQNPLAPHIGHELLVETADARRIEEIAGGTTYFHQLEHVMAVIAGVAKPVTGGADAINTMRVLDAVYQCARSD